MAKFATFKKENMSPTMKSYEASVNNTRHKRFTKSEQTLLEQRGYRKHTECMFIHKNANHSIEKVTDKVFNCVFHVPATTDTESHMERYDNMTFEDMIMKVHKVARLS